MTWPRLAGHGAGIQSITPFFSGGGIDSSAAAPFSFSPIIHMEYDRGPAFRLSNRATPSKLPAYRCPAPPVTRNLLHAPFFFLGGAPFISWPLTPGPSSPLVPPSLPSSLPTCYPLSPSAWHHGSWQRPLKNINAAAGLWVWFPGGWVPDFGRSFGGYHGPSQAKCMGKQGAKNYFGLFLSLPRHALWGVVHRNNNTTNIGGVIFLFASRA